MNTLERLIELRKRFNSTQTEERWEIALEELEGMRNQQNSQFLNALVEFTYLQIKLERELTQTDSSKWFFKNAGSAEELCNVLAELTVEQLKFVKIIFKEKYNYMIFYPIT
jgi:hypothetical protein